MKSYAVVRANLSPYQATDFVQRERSVLEGLSGIEYRTLSDGGHHKDIVLITNTHTILKDLPRDILQKTRLILHPNSGYDHFRDGQDLWKDIPTVIGHKIRAHAVAEYSLGCLFEGMLEIPQHISWSKDRKWGRPLLKGLHICVFGHGHIGKIITDTLMALGMRVTIVDPFKPGFPKSWKEIDLKKMRAVISCMSLNSTSRHLFNEDFFANAHEELLFINGARGGLVKENVLKDFLLTHPGAFAFLDVFETEPFTQGWPHFPQIWKTSHIAGVHRNLDQGIIDFEYEVLKDFLELSDDQFLTKYQQEILQNKWIQGELI